MSGLGPLCAYICDSVARYRNVRAHQFIKLFGYFREVVVPRMRDFPFSTVSSEPVFCEHEVSARRGVFIRQSVAHEDRGRASAIEQTHHRRFAGRTAMSARLVERRKINSPTICVRLHVARKNLNATQMARKLSTLQNRIDAVVKAIADDVYFNRVRGARFK